MKLKAIIHPDSDTGRFVVECPEVGTASQGHTKEEALANLREATELYLESFPETRERLEHCLFNLRHTGRDERS
jgi:predicted RNase H-like HicB family nuclease